MQKLKRNINMGFRVDKDEHYFLQARMKQAGWSNFRNFIIHLAVRGYIVKFESERILELSQLLRNLSNNMNQLTKRVNSGGSAYREDVAEINNQLTEIRADFGKALTFLSEIADGKHSKQFMTPIRISDLTERLTEMEGV